MPTIPSDEDAYIKNRRFLGTKMSTNRIQVRNVIHMLYMMLLKYSKSTSRYKMLAMLSTAVVTST